MNPIFAISLGDARAVKDWYRRELSHGGCFVASSARPAPFTAVRIRFEFSMGPSVEVAATVVNQTLNGFYVEFVAGPERDALMSAVEFMESLASGTHSGVVLAPPLTPSPADTAPPKASTARSRPPDERPVSRGRMKAVFAEATGSPDEVATPEATSTASGSASSASPPANVYTVESGAAARTTRQSAVTATRPTGLAHRDASMAPWSLLRPGRPLPEQLASLSADQKRALARLGDRSTRDALVADDDPDVVLEVLSNPRVTTSELLGWVGRPDLPLRTLVALSRSAGARVRPSVRAAIAAHPGLNPTDETAA